jgi:hypothetical protein
MTGKIVYFDDCQHSTGMMVDAKGPGYAQLLTYPWGPQSVGSKLMAQSLSQIAAAGDRPIRWYFAEIEAAEFARELFGNSGEGRTKIDVEFLPWPK